MSGRGFAIASTVIGLLAVVVVALYLFGMPQAPVAAPADAGAAAAAAGGAQGAPVADTGEVNVPASGSEVARDDDPIAVRIPGCRCHSKDPKVVKQHSKYRISECAKCHAGGLPGMGR
jgi:hypothetical protein